MNAEIRTCLAPDRLPHTPTLKLPEGSIDTHVHVFDNRYTLSAARGYTPPEATLEDLKHLHTTLGIERVVLTQPSAYGTDNSAIIDAAGRLNAATPGRARMVVAIDADTTEDQIAALDKLGARGVRLNTDNQGGMPIKIGELPELEAKLRPFGWHIEWLFPGQHILELMPVFGAMTIPMSIAHFAYQPASAGIESPGFQALCALLRNGNTWVKISAPNRVSATDLPPYDDVLPMVTRLLEANGERVMWGTDWPHPDRYEVNPNDGDLVTALGDWITDDVVRTRIIRDTPAAFYQF